MMTESDEWIIQPRKNRSPERATPTCSSGDYRTLLWLVLSSTGHVDCWPLAVWSMTGSFFYFFSGTNLFVKCHLVTYSGNASLWGETFVSMYTAYQYAVILFLCIFLKREVTS